MQPLLKQQNQTKLVAFAVAHALGACWVALGAPLTIDAASALAAIDITKASGVAAINLVVMLANSVVHRDLKAKLVFLALKHPYPGSRAFSELADDDPRVDLERLKEVAGGEFPTDPGQQNKVWYRLYQKHGENPAVRQNNMEFLLFRDLTWLAAVGVFLGAGGTILVAGISTASMSYLLASLATVMLFMLAARNKGEALVVTVLAVSSATESANAVAADRE